GHRRSGGGRAGCRRVRPGRHDARADRRSRDAEEGQRGPRRRRARVCRGRRGLHRPPAAGQVDHVRAESGDRPRGRADGDPPDAVVLATGATQRVPDIPGVRLPHVATTVDVLTGRTAPGRRVVVVDEEGYFAAPTTADFLAERGAQVTIVCRYFMVGEDIDEGTRSDLYARLFTRGVTLIPMTVAREILPRGVRTRHTFANTEAIVEADSVVLAFGGKAT